MYHRGIEIYRGGDYTDDPNAYHPRCTNEYYAKAMLQFPFATTFVIFTDDKEAAIKIFGTEQLYMNGNYLEDFKVMKRCKSFICANSSYSLFAAILGAHPEKKIVCPSRWFGPPAAHLNVPEIYPEGAIII